MEMQVHKGDAFWSFFLQVGSTFPSSNRLLDFSTYSAPLFQINLSCRRTTKGQAKRKKLRTINKCDYGHGKLYVSVERKSSEFKGSWWVKLVQRP